MNQNVTVEAVAFLPALKANIDEFVGDAPQFDDITMLMFDYKPKQRGVHITNKTFPAKIETLSEVLGFVDQTLESYECPMKIQTAICVAIEEVFVNVAHYPNPHRDENGKIIIENSELYYDDVKQHGAYQAQQWVKQGKYNLTPDELNVEHARIQLKMLKLYSIGTRMKPEEEKSKAEYERIIADANIDWTQTKAVKAWSRAHSVNMSYREKSQGCDGT